MIDPASRAGLRAVVDQHRPSTAVGLRERRRHRDVDASDGPS